METMTEMLESPVTYHVQIKRNKGSLWVQCPYELKDRMHIPTMTWVSKLGLWVGQDTPAVASQLIQAFFDVDLDIEPEIRQDAQAMRLIQEIKTCPIETLSIPRTRSKLWPHQIRGYHLIRSVKGGCHLGFDMGCGKSLCVVTYVTNDVEGLVLIVAPKAVLPVWPKEFEKHAAPDFLKETRVLALTDDNVKERARKAEWYINMQKAGRCKRLVLVVNYESVWREAMADVLEPQEWALIVADECHMIKAPAGVASTFLHRLGKHAVRRVGLSGTLLAHSPMDVYAQYRFLDSGVFGTSVTNFRTHYAVMGGFQNHQILSFKNLEDLHDKIYTIGYRVTKEEVLKDLPEAQHVERYVELDKASRRVYQSLEDDFICDVKGEIITVSNAMVKVLRLQQVTSGYGVSEDGKVIDEISTAKSDELKEIFDEIDPAEPIVVICRFTHDVQKVKEIAQACGRRPMELSGQANELAEWQQASGGEVLSMQIQTGRAGIEVTRSKYCVYYSIGCSLSDYEQSLARMHRPGQKRNVTYIHLLASKTVDEKVYAALMKRKEVIQSIMEEIKQDE